MTREIGGKPHVSVVVVIHDMGREAPRTLYSLSAAYQRHIDPDDYEVIVVDNGSNPPFDIEGIKGLSGNFRLVRIDDALPSPAQATNRGLAEARGAVIGVMVDGARIATPGLLHFARHGARLAETAVVVAPGWYLGYDFQRWAIRYGYDQPREDALLASIDWPQDGYRLFEIATVDESSVDGWLQPIAEANALFMPRNSWDQLGGMDDRFDAPGGGLVNLDMYSRAMELPGAQLVLLLGEGTFHQLHGGVATNVSPEELEVSFHNWDRQYEQLRGRRYQIPNPKKSPMYVGTLPRPALTRFVRAAVAPIGHSDEPPLGQGFDQQLWTLQPPIRPADRTIAALVELAQEEFRCGRYETTVGIARLIRSRAPEEPEPQRLLSLSAPAIRQEPGAEHFFALGEAHRLLGESESAAANYRKALTLNRNFPEAHRRLATLLMPGDLQDGSAAQSVEAISIRDIQLHFWDGPTRPPPSNEKVIYIHKDRPFVSRMEAVLDQVKPRRMIEIGILDGGSTIFWQDKYQLECLIAFELAPDAPHLVSYLQRHQLGAAVHLYFGVSQANGKALRRGVLNHTGGQPVDAVVDDASHQYAETRTTVEALLPFVRPGGVYIIEDWGWGHNAKWPAELWTNQPLLSPLVMELTLICGHASGIIEKIDIDPNFIAIWRGNTPLPQDGGFKLTDHYVARGFSVSL